MPAAFEPDAAQEALDGVLAEPPFKGQPLGTEGLLARLWDLLRNWIEGAGSLHADNPFAFWLLLGVLLALLALLLWHISVTLRDLWRSVRRAGELVEAEPSDAPAIDLTAAHRAFDAGDYRRAVELAWSLTVRGLFRRSATGSPLSDSTQTPRAQARALSRYLLPRHGAALEHLLRAHEQACYAGIEPSRELAENALGAAHGLLEGA